MTKRETMAVWTIVFGFLSAFFVGMGTNIWLGCGVFFGLWCLAGIYETPEQSDDR